MPLASRLALLIGLLSTFVLGLFGLVSFQSAESIGQVREQRLLEALGTSILAELAEQRALSGDQIWVERLSRQPEQGVFAFFLDPDGWPRSLHPSDDAAALSALDPTLLDRIRQDTASDDQSLRVGQSRYIWVKVPIPNASEKLIILNLAEDQILTQYLTYMAIPLIVVTIICLWGTVWLSLIISRMTDRLQRQKILEVTLREAEEASRAKDAFLAHMSHELRTPLNAIIGFSQSLQLRVFGPVGSQKNAEYVDAIHDAGNHLLRLIGQVLDHSRIGSGNETVDEDEIIATDLVEECVAMMAAQTERLGHSMTITAEERLPGLRADRLKIKQVLLNILSNAVKFTPPGGHIEIGIFRDGARNLAISVRDNGVGIAAKDLEEVKKPFGRASSAPHLSKGGTGLGLSLSTSLMELHGGSLELESELGKGTTVTVRFPPERTLFPVAL